MAARQSDLHPSHAYAETSTVDDPSVGLTVLYRDGTTASQQLTFHVDGQPQAGPPGAFDLDSSSDGYPGRGEAVTVRITPREIESAVEVFAHWGEGTAEQSQRIPWPTREQFLFSPAVFLEVNHTYTYDRRFEATFTLVLRDGSTSTQVVTYDVGGTPPSNTLSFLQRAFSPENQEVTFFVLGLLVTIFGAIVGLAVRSRYQSRIHVLLETVDSIRRQGATDPTAAIARLALFRQGLDRQMAEGRLQETQYQVVQGKATTLLRRLLDAALSGVPLSLGYRNRMEGAMQDGVLDREEEAALVAELKKEDVTPGQATAIAGLLSSWRPAIS
jgi:hypothetical protein